MRLCLARALKGERPPTIRLVAMSPIDLSAGLPSRVGFTPASGPLEVKWIRPDTPAHLPPPMLKSVQERTERTDALIVIVLTLPRRSIRRLGGSEAACPWRLRRVPRRL